MSSLAPFVSSGFVASGCYDGMVRLWASASGGAGSSEPAASFAAHKGPVKAAVAVPSSAGQLLLTVGGDMVGRVWRDVAPEAPGGQAPAQPEALAVLRGHGEGIEAAVASGDGAWCCTGGWDSKLLLWQSGAVQCDGFSTLLCPHGRRLAVSRAACFLPGRGVCGILHGWDAGRFTSVVAHGIHCDRQMQNKTLRFGGLHRLLGTCIHIIPCHALELQETAC